MFKSRFFQAYVIPVSVYLSVSIAGGYGTGREVVEFFTRHGVYGGFYGLIAAAFCIAILSALTFELARQAKAYDYRTFFKSLIGPLWIVFELLYICLLLLVLAVVGSAAGAIISEHTFVPEKLGLLIMLGLISVLIFYGREAIEKVMVFLTLFLFAAFTLYFIIILSSSWGQIADEVARASAPSEVEWLVSALKFTLYSSPAAAFVLYATQGIQTRKEALVSGMLCGLFIMFPGFLFHISFLGSVPDILTQQVPVHWVINNQGGDILLSVYLFAMVGTFLGTGSGFIQAVNERLDVWSLEKLGRVLSPMTHSGVAITGLLLSAILGQLGVIALIAKGYGTIAWGFLVVFVIPILLFGIRSLINTPPSNNEPSES
jgi:uncharacterized membrane protein YkvI